MLPTVNGKLASTNTNTQNLTLGTAVTGMKIAKTIKLIYSGIYNFFQLRTVLLTTLKFSSFDHKLSVSIFNIFNSIQYKHYQFTTQLNILLLIILLIYQCCAIRHMGGCMVQTCMEACTTHRHKVGAATLPRLWHSPF